MNNIKRNNKARQTMIQIKVLPPYKKNGTMYRFYIKFVYYINL